MLRLVALSLTVGLLSLSVQAQTPAAPAYTGPEYVRSEAMIPVRDGVKLHTVILRPKGSEASGAALPFLMQRTPYGVDGSTRSR